MFLSTEFKRHNFLLHIFHFWDLNCAQHLELGVHPMAWLPSAASDCSQHHRHSLAWRIVSLKAELSHPLRESGDCCLSLSCSFQGDEQPGEFWSTLTSHPTKAVQWIFIHPQKAKHFLKAMRTEFLYNELNPALPAPPGYPTYSRRTAQGGSCFKVCHVLPKFAFRS